MKGLSFVLVALFLAADPAGVRTWTDSTGQYKTEAEFLDFQDGIVRLRRADNGEIKSVPLEKLSEADQQFVKSRMEPRGGSAADKVGSVPQGDRGDAPSADGAIPVRVVERLKAATVLVKVVHGAEEGSGSGFLLKKEQGVGYVVTNAHVVADPRQTSEPVATGLQCVFHSGSKREQSTAATVVGLDEQHDLAILRVEMDVLPEPVGLDAKVAVAETLPVLIIGFPFGDVLRTSERHPAVTISRASISGIRRDDDDRVTVIQIEGGINPGNSGGPVVDSQGRLIGIAVAKVVGTQIGLAIPAVKLSEMLNGRVAVAYIVPRTPKDGVANVVVEVRLIDPLMENIKSVSIHYVREDTLKERPKPDQNGLWQRLPDAQTVELQLQGRTARGELKVPCGDTTTAVVYAYQIAHESGDGKLVNTEPGTFTVGLDADVTGKLERPTVGRPPWASPDGRPRVVEFSWRPPRINVITPPAETAVEGRIEQEASGRRYVALTAKGVPLDLGNDVLQVVACPTGKVVYVIRRSEPVVAVVDPLTWKTVAEIAVPEWPASIWADAALIAVACDKNRVVVLIDAHEHSVVASGKVPELAGYAPDTVIGRAPDGSVMTIWGRKRADIPGRTSPDPQRALVHVGTDGKARIMLNDEPIYWATWLPDGTGVVTQGSFARSPSGTLHVVLPPDPKDVFELHVNRLFGNLGLGSVDAGPAFLTSDRGALVYRRIRLAPQDWAISANGYRPDESVDERRGDPSLRSPWTYLISPSFDEVLREFPGSAFVELPAQRLFIAVGNIRSSERTSGGAARTALVCYYVSSADGRVVREITLQWPSAVLRPQLEWPVFPHSGAVFVPGHELLLLPNPDYIRLPPGASFGGGGFGRSTPIAFRFNAYTAFRCGPVANNVVQVPRSAAPVNGPPSSAIVGEEIRYTPILGSGVMASEFRLKRALPGMTIDPKTGAFAWRPGREHAGQWQITILAAVDAEEVTVITWTLKVR